jgi:hypothetical protein
VADGSVSQISLFVIDVAGDAPVETIELATEMSADMSWQRLAP